MSEGVGEWEEIVGGTNTDWVSEGVREWEEIVGEMEPGGEGESGVSGGVG